MVKAELRTMPEENTPHPPWPYRWNDEANARYRIETTHHELAALRMMALLPTLLYPTGLFLDWYTHPEHLNWLMADRFLSSAYCGLIYAASFRSRFVKQNPYSFILAIMFGNAATLTAMSLKLEGYESPYYAGITIVLFVTGVMMPGGAKALYKPQLGVLAIYVLPVLYQAGFKLDSPRIFVNNMVFLVWAFIMSLWGCQRREAVRRESFMRQLEVEEGRKELLKANQKLKSADELRSRFFANVSHELRTPLMLIMGTIQGIQSLRGRDHSEHRELTVMDSNAKLILKHVNDLLDISKLDANQMKLEYFRVDLGPFLRRLGSFFENEATRRGIEFKIQAPTNFESVIDPEKFQQVILNLLSNAFKFVPNGSQINCELKAIGKEIEITVEDDGPGIPPSQTATVFERFKQTEDVDRRRHGGTGLGLAIAQELVHLHQGRIWIETPQLDSKYAGAVFKVLIPRYGMPPASVPTWLEDSNSLPILNSGPTEGGLPLPEQTCRDGAPVVLIVEDNIDMGQYIIQCLQPEFKALHATNGKRGLELARELRPDLILSDIMMPEMSGEDLLQLIRADSDLRDTPLIVLSAKADDEGRAQLLATGAHDYLVKPFHREELAARVRIHVELHRSRQALQKELSSRSTTLDALTLEIVEKKRRIEASSTLLENALKKAQVANQAKSRFLNMVSHELRTPLTVFNNGVFALKDADEPQRRKLLELLTRTSQHLIFQVETILEYLRVVDQGPPKGVGPVRVDELAQSLISAFEARNSSKPVQYYFIPPRGELSVITQKGFLNTIISCLLDNASKYTERGSITVQVEPWAQNGSCGAQIVVTDTGPGIPPEEMSHIFEALERIDDARAQRVHGFGVGLTLARDLTRALNGTIQVKNGDRQGSTFTVRIPDATSETEAGTKEKNA